MVEIPNSQQSGVGTVRHDTASPGSVVASRADRQHRRAYNVTHPSHASRANPVGDARNNPLSYEHEHRYSPADQARFNVVSWLQTQTAQPTVVVRKNTNVAATATRYARGGDAGPAGRLSERASAIAASPCPPDQGGVGGHTGADRPTDQPTERPPLTYRVWQLHYLCDDCPNEWMEEGLVVGPSFCPACDREHEPYASFELLEDAI